MFNIRLENWNCGCVLGLSRNLFLILHNITTLIGIARRGQVCECGIYVWLFIIGALVGIKDFCDEYGRLKHVWGGGGYHQSYHVVAYKIPALF